MQVLEKSRFEVDIIDNWSAFIYRVEIFQIMNTSNSLIPCLISITKVYFNILSEH